MNSERLIHSLKTAIAVAIGFSLTRIISFPYAQWIIITILVVMCAQIYVGSVLQKSYLRFLGTLCGCAIALITIQVFHSSLLSILLTLVIASFVFSYIATSTKDGLSYFSTMGCVTLAIIVLGQRMPSLEFAATRFLEISVGILIATLISQLVFPIHAKTHLRKTQQKTLQQLRDFYDKTLVANLADVQTVDHHDLDEEIIKSLLKQRQLAKESVREPFGESFSAEYFTQLLFYERQLLRAINFLHLAQNKMGINPLPSAIVVFHQEVLAALDCMIAQTEPSTWPSLTEVQALPSSEKDIYLNAFIFNAQVIVDNVHRLGELYGK